MTEGRLSVGFRLLILIMAKCAKLKTPTRNYNKIGIAPMKKFLMTLVLATGSLLVNTAFAEMVNINKANADIMQNNLKGIGIKKAEAIISYRTEHGDFKKLEDIKEVKGIGDALFEKIKADISLDQGLGSEGAAGAKGVEPEKKVEDKAAKAEKPDVKLSKEDAKQEAKAAE
jgi:competence protein ComEA